MQVDEVNLDMICKISEVRPPYSVGRVIHWRLGVGAISKITFDFKTQVWAVHLEDSVQEFQDVAEPLKILRDQTSAAGGSISAVTYGRIMGIISLPELKKAGRTVKRY